MSTVKLTADSGGGTVALAGPSTTTGNAAVTFKLPIADGSSGSALTTNASGQLAFSSAVNSDAAAKAWVNVETVGTDATVDSYNVSGVSFTNDAEIVVSFDTDFANTNYAWAGGASRSDTTGYLTMANVTEKMGDRAAGACTLRLAVSNSSGNIVHSTSTEFPAIMAVFYGDQ